MATAPLTRPLPLGFSASPEGGERASGGLGDCRAWGWGSRRSDPAGFPFIFQRRKWERHSGRQQMPRHPRATGRNESSLLATLKRATPRAPPGRAPREPPPSKGLRPEDFGWEMEDPSQGHHRPMLGPPRHGGASRVWSFSQGDLAHRRQAATVPWQGASSPTLRACRQGLPVLGWSWSSQPLSCPAFGGSLVIPNSQPFRSALCFRPCAKAARTVPVTRTKSEAPRSGQCSGHAFSSHVLAWSSRRRDGVDASSFFRFMLHRALLHVQVRASLRPVVTSHSWQEGRCPLCAGGPGCCLDYSLGQEGAPLLRRGVDVDRLPPGPLGAQILSAVRP